MYPDGPLLTMSRTTPLSESGIRAGSRHPLRAAGVGLLASDHLFRGGVETQGAAEAIQHVCEVH